MATKKVKTTGIKSIQKQIKNNTFGETESYESVKKRLDNPTPTTIRGISDAKAVSNRVEPVKTVESFDNIKQRILGNDNSIFDIANKRAEQRASSQNAQNTASRARQLAMDMAKDQSRKNIFDNANLMSVTNNLKPSSNVVLSNTKEYNKNNVGSYTGRASYLASKPNWTPLEQKEANNIYTAMMEKNESSPTANGKEWDNAYTGLQTRLHPKATAAASGFVKGSGLESLAKVIAANTNQDPGERYYAMQQNMADNPGASGAGQTAGQLAKLMLAGKLVGAGANALGVGNNLAGHVATNAATFGLSRGISDAGDYALDNSTVLRNGKVLPGKLGTYAKGTATSALGGGLGTVASSAVGKGIANVLQKNGMMTPFMEFVRQGTASSAFAGTDIGVDYLLADEKPSSQELGQNLATAFAFSFITSGLNTIEQTSATKEYLKKQVENAVKDFEYLTQGQNLTEEEYRIRIDEILKRTEEIRTSINSQYLAGSQTEVNKFNAALDTVEMAMNARLEMLDAGNATNILPGEASPVEPVSSVVPYENRIPELEPVEENIPTNAEQLAQLMAQDQVNEGFADIPEEMYPQEESIPQNVVETTNIPEEKLSTNDNIPVADVPKEIVPSEAEVKNTQEIFDELANTYGKTGKEAFTNVVNAENAIEEHKGFKKLYDAAKSLEPNAVEEAKSTPEVQKLSFEQQSVAVSAGIEDAKLLAKENANVRENGISTRSNGNVPFSTRKSVEGLHEGTETVRGKWGDARKTADDSAGDLKIRSVKAAEEVIKSAEPGQKIYTFEGETESVSLAKQIDAQSNSNTEYYVSENGGIKVKEDGYVAVARGSWDASTGNITVCANNEHATAYQIRRHEAVEEAIGTGKFDSEEFVSLLNKSDENTAQLFDTLARAYSQDLVKGRKELLCDIGGEINQFQALVDMGYEEYEQLADYADLIINELHAGVNSKLGGKLDITDNAAKANAVKQNDTKEVDSSIVGKLNEESISTNDMSYSIQLRGKIAEKTEKYNSSHNKVNDVILKNGIKQADEMGSIMEPYLQKEGILPADIVGKTIFSNGSYGRTGENTTICVRTLTYEDFKDRIANVLGRPLTVKESLLASQKIYDIATEPQCIYCYVAADRKSYDEYLGTYFKAMDHYIKSLKNGGDFDVLYNEYLNGRKDTKVQQKRFREWNRIANSGEAYITAKDLATRSRRNEIIANGGKLAAEIKDAQKYAQSASWAKKVEDYRAYGGDILKFSDKLVKELNSEYGFRMYSFSDYTPAFILENMQMITDASVKGLKSLAYTKDTDYAEIFASTGQAINISCFAKLVNGEYVPDERQGANWAKTQELRKQHNNVGAVMVATNDAMVKWALKQDWIDVVIPYHIVKTGTTIANEYDWQNFTADSSDKIGNKNANILPPEHNNSFESYNALVKERGITPRFNQYYQLIGSEITPDQYMKLVNEVRLPAYELSHIKPIFNMDAAKKSFSAFVDKGGYTGSWYKEGIDVNQEVLAVANDIKAGKSSLDVDYGASKRLSEEEYKQTVNAVRKKAKETHYSTQLQPKDYTNYLTDDAKKEYTKDERFKNWKHKNLAYLSAASFDGVTIPYEELKNIPEIIEAEEAASFDVDYFNRYIPGTNPIVDSQRVEFEKRLLDEKHGSAVFENGKIAKDKNGNEVFTGKVNKERKAFIVIGRPAGGKSSVFANPLSYNNKARIIDSDIVKPWINGFNDGLGAGYVQEESSYIADTALKYAVKQGENIVIPKIGGLNSITQIANTLKENGYSISLYFNDIPSDVSLIRAASRFAQEGRYLSLKYINSIGDKPSNTFFELAESGIFDYAEWRDNNVGFKEEPKLIWKTGYGDLKGYTGIDRRDRLGSKEGVFGNYAENVGRWNEIIEENDINYSTQIKPNESALKDSVINLKYLNDVKNAEEVERRNDKFAYLNTEFNDALQNVKGNRVSSHQSRQIADKFMTGRYEVSDRKDIKNEIAELYDLLGNATKTNARQLSTAATAIAEKILDKEITTEQTPDQKRVSDFIKGTTFYISPALKKEIVSGYDSYSDFKRQFRKLFNVTLTEGKGVPVDEWYTGASGEKNDTGTTFPNEFRDKFPVGISTQMQQLEKIIEVAEDSRIGVKMQPDIGDDYEERAYMLGQEILANYFEASGNPKYMQKITEIKKELKEDYEERLEYTAQKYHDQIIKVKKSKDDELAKREARFLAYKEKQREKRMDKEAVDDLWKKLKQLDKMRGGPEFEKQKEAIFSTITAKRRGALSANTIERLNNMRDAVASSDPTSPSFMVGVHARALREIEEAEKKSAGELNKEELFNYMRAVEDLLYYQKTENLLFDETKGKYVSEKGRKMMNQQGDMKKLDYKNKLGVLINQYKLYGLNPMRALPLLDGYDPNGILTEYAEKFQKGEMKKETFKMNAEKAFSEWLDDEQYMEELIKPTFTVTTKKGSSITVSRAMAMSMYLAGMDADNVKHTEGMGWLVPDVEVYNRGETKNAYGDKRFYMQQRDYLDLEKQLDTRDKEFADRIHEYFNGGDHFKVSAKDALNEVSMKLYGYQKAMTKDYFPINTDKNLLASDIDVSRDPMIENSGFTKERNHNSQLPIYLEDVTMVLKRNIDQMGKYYGLAIPLRDFNSIYNYTAWNDPYSTSKFATSAKEQLFGAWKSVGQTYLENLISDLNRGSREKPKDLFDYAYAGYGAAVLGANARVMLSQASSYPMALTVLHPDSLLHGITASNKNVDMDYIDSITPSMYLRRKGMTGTQLGEMYSAKQRLKQKGKIGKLVADSLDILGGGIQVVDVFTTTHLVSAAMYEMDKYYPQYKKGTKAYDRKLASLIEEVNTRTQPSQGVLDKNEFSKKPGSGYRLLTMFKTQTFNMYGELVDAYGRAKAYKDMNKRGMISDSEVKKANNALGVAIGAVLMSQILFEMIKKAVNATLYHRGDEVTDENGEFSAAVAAKSVVTSTLSDIIGMAPGADIAINQTVVPIAKKALGIKTTIYDIDAPGLGTINDLRTSSGYLADSFANFYADPTEANKSKLMENGVKFAIKASYFGYPVQNVWNTIDGITKNVKYGMFKYEDNKGIIGVSDTSYTKNMMGDIMENHFNNGDYDKFITEYNKIHTKYGEDKANSEVKSMLKKNETVNAYATDWRDWYGKSAKEKAEYIEKLQKELGKIGSSKPVEENLKSVIVSLMEKDREDDPMYLSVKDIKTKYKNSEDATAEQKKKNAEAKEKDIKALMKGKTEKDQKIIWDLAGYGESTFKMQ